MGPASILALVALVTPAIGDPGAPGTVGGSQPSNGLDRPTASQPPTGPDLQAGPELQVGPQLQVWDGRRFVTVLDSFDGSPAVIPLSTTHTAVTRAAVTVRGVRVRLEGGEAPDPAWSASFVRHAPDERLLLAGGRILRSGPPSLTVEARFSPETLEEGDPLPAMARQDGIGAEVEGARIDAAGEEAAAAGRATVLIPLRTSPSTPATFPLAGDAGSELPVDDGRLAPGFSSAFVVEPGAAPLVLGPGATVDMLFEAAVTALAVEQETPVTVRPSDLEGEYSITVPPDAFDGGTGTLLLRIDPTRVRATGEQALTPPPAHGVLVDVTEQLGADLMHLEGPHEQLDIRPTMGPGAAWGDLDDDGLPDLYLVQGGGRDGAPPISNRLRMNRAERGFVDVTAAAGVGDSGWGMGAQFVDLDGDGALDLYVANYGADVLYRALEPGDEAPRFGDVTSEAGVNGERWSAGISAGDPDRDGDLDLYVTGYLVYDEELMPPLEDLPLAREDPIAMLPFAFPGERNVYYRNVSQPGALRLEDATDELDLADVEGRGMQPTFFDYDGNGTQDLYIANDVSLNRLYRVSEDGLFTDIAFQTGMDDPRGGMGVTIGDVDGDLDEDLFLTNWELEPNAMYRNNIRTHTSQRRRVASFRDVTVQAGFGTFGIGFTSWGCELFDLELDGDLDLFVANGYTSPDYETTGICVGQPNHLYLNDGDGRFTLASDLAGPDVSVRHASRCVAACDYDRDGDVDLLVTANNGPVQLFENRAERPEGAQWIGLRLRQPGENAHAVGAHVTVEVGERRWARSLRAGTSYLAGNPLELHFGLGRVEGPAVIDVRWPDGVTTEHRIEALSRWITIERE